MTLKKIIIAFVALQLLALPLLFVMDSQFLSNLFLIGCLAGIMIWAARRFGAVNIIHAMQYDRAARFERSEPADGTYRYVITPARLSRTGVVTALVIAIVPSLLLPVLFPLFFFFGFFTLNVCLRGLEHRKQTEIVISPDTLKAGEQVFQRDDIMELLIRQLFSLDDTHYITRDGRILQGQGFLYNLIWSRQADRSFEIGLRCKSSSDVFILAGGLTEECVTSLQNNIASVLFR